MRTLGTVSDIRRYPVKSFAGEQLSSVDIVTTGLYGDRSHAYIDPTKAGWYRYITARRVPDMLRYQATLVEKAEAAGGARPILSVKTPDGDVLGWEEALHLRIQALVDDKIEPVTCPTQNNGEPAFDEGAILIVTDASLRALEARWGRLLDPLRFRPNIIIRLNDDTPYAEKTWIGRSIRLGSDVALRLDALCIRCQIIGLDPASLAADGSLLPLLAGEQSACFGVYASVVTAGRLHAGDSVTPID